VIPIGQGAASEKGLMFIDHQTQARIPKINAGYYRNVIARNAVLTPESGESLFNLIGVLS
jgi:hypothetical protein